MSGPRHPYVGKPDFQFWKSAPGSRDPAELDPVAGTSFRIGTADRVVTAGSCFAQHVARHLVMAGLNHHVTEPGHPMLPPEIRAEFNYGVFSARYGNLYTTRQLRQLLERAYGAFEPLADFWERPDGRVADPFRPQIQPKGFVSRAEARLDRRAASRRRPPRLRGDGCLRLHPRPDRGLGGPRDGAVFPLAPGVAAGRYDPDLHRFQNFGATEVIEDLNRSIEAIRARNPRGPHPADGLAGAAQRHRARAPRAGLDHLLEGGAAGRRRGGPRHLAEGRLLPLLRDHHRPAGARALLSPPTPAPSSRRGSATSWASSSGITPRSSRPKRRRRRRRGRGSALGRDGRSYPDPLRRRGDLQRGGTPAGSDRSALDLLSL